MPDDDVVRLEAELVGDHLGQHCGGSLTVRRGAGDEQRLAGRVHAQHRALVGSEPGEQHVRGDANADEATAVTPGALNGLLGTSLPVARQGQRGVERRFVVAAVVDHRDLRRREPELPRELVATDEVLPADFGGIHPELLRELIHGALDREHRLRLPGASIRGRRRLARERRAHAARIVTDPVGPRQARRGDRGTEHPEAPRVGAEVGEQLGAHRDDRPVAARRELDVVPLLARVRGVRHVLVTRLDPFHRRAQAHRQQREHDLFRIDLLLHAETTAHVRRDHANPMLAEPEDVAKRVAQSVRPLGR